jgi:hypothetical protein
MMISPTGASPYAAAAALDRQFRQGSDASDDGAPSPSADGGPDVVVTLGQGTSAPSTYDASGKLAGAPAAADASADDAGSDAGDDAPADAGADNAVPA